MISIWGFMGAGKSTLGAQLSKAFQWEHVDSDNEIIRRENMSIPEIFERFGERYFRQLETRFLQELVTDQQKGHSNEDIVLTTGGGMPMSYENRELLKALGTSVYIHVPFQVIASRLGRNSNRPLWDDNQLETMQSKYDERLPFYQKADHVVHVKQHTREELINLIGRFVGI